MADTTPTAYPHVALNETGKPVIAGTRMKVQHLAMAHHHHGWSAEELRWQFPTLSMAEIHAALSYYYDHRDDLDRQAQADDEWIRELGRVTAQNPILDKVRQLKLSQITAS